MFLYYRNKPMGEKTRQQLNKERTQTKNSAVTLFNQHSTINEAPVKPKFLKFKHHPG